MNYANITKDDLNNGDGFRVGLWVQGCNHHCMFCQNPETWDKNKGLPFQQKEIDEILNELNKSYIKGLSLSGGDPLFPENREEITNLCRLVKSKYPNKDIWCWTGYVYEEIKNLEILNYIDILVDGEFVNHLKDLSLRWRGSSNQRVIDVAKTRENNKIVLYE